MEKQLFWGSRRAGIEVALLCSSLLRLESCTQYLRCATVQYLIKIYIHGVCIAQCGTLVPPSSLPGCVHMTAQSSPVPTVPSPSRPTTPREATIRLQHDLLRPRRSGRLHITQTFRNLMMVSLEMMQCYGKCSKGVDGGIGLWKEF